MKKFNHTLNLSDVRKKSAISAEHPSSWWRNAAVVNGNGRVDGEKTVTLFIYYLITLV